MTKKSLSKNFLSPSSYARDIFFKEALLMSKICPKNIVLLIAVSEDIVPIMMEYLVFSFKPFPRIEKFNSLNQLLQYLSTKDLLTYFLGILNFMTSDIGKGLVYLHENMVHRDIKPVIYSSPKPTMHMRQNTQHPCLKKTCVLQTC